MAGFHQRATTVIEAIMVAGVKARETRVKRSWIVMGVHDVGAS